MDDRIEISWEDLPEEPPGTTFPRPGTSGPPSTTPPTAPSRPLGPLPAPPPPQTLPPIAAGGSPVAFGALKASRSGPPWALILAAGALVVVVAIVFSSIGGEDDRLEVGGSAGGQVDVDEEDRYDIEGHGELVVVRVIGEGGFDPTVAVEDRSGFEVGSNDDSDLGLDSYLEVYLSAGEDYRIVVAGYGGGAGSYRVEVE